MHKKILLTLIVAVLFAIGFLFFLSFKFNLIPAKFVPKFLNKENSPSFFANVENEPIPSKPSPIPTVKEPSETVKDFQVLLESNKTIESTSTWNWQNSYVLFRIDGGDPETKTLILSVLAPEGASIGASPITVKLECTLQQTAALNDFGKNFLDENFDLFNRIVGGENLYSYCLDENCVSIGKECILMM
jgi:hypothetical protein